MSDQPIPTFLDLILRLATIGLTVAALAKGASPMDSTTLGLGVMALLVGFVCVGVWYLNSSHKNKAKAKRLEALALFAEDQALATREPPEKALMDIRAQLERVLEETLPASSEGWQLKARSQSPSFADPRSNPASHLGGKPS